MKELELSDSYNEFLIEQLRDPEEAAAYLNAAMEEDEDTFLLALQNVANAQRPALPAKQVDLFALVAVLRALNLQFAARRI